MPDMWWWLTWKTTLRLAKNNLATANHWCSLINKIWNPLFLRLVWTTNHPNLETQPSRLSATTSSANRKLCSKLSMDTLFFSLANTHKIFHFRSYKFSSPLMNCYPLPFIPRPHSRQQNWLPCETTWFTETWCLFFARQVWLLEESFSRSFHSRFACGARTPITELSHTRQILHKNDFLFP